MKAMSFSVPRQRVSRPVAVARRRTTRDVVESSLYYFLAYLAVLPYVTVKRILPRSWTAGFIGYSKSPRRSVFREAHVEVQNILGIVFRA
ncbi:MAG: hypothetical protein AAF654_00110 [Myxococcota bacterium]